jgi:DNA-binding transcriptional ArsR family regulator
MLELEFTVADLARTRFVHSPLWEIVASVRVLKNPRRHALHQRWAGDVRRRLDASGPEPDLLFDLIDPALWYVPDFLSPPPRTPLPDLDAELAALRSLQPEHVRADLDVLAYALRKPTGSLAETGLPRRIRSARRGELPSQAVANLYAAPTAGLERLAEQLHAYWKLAIGPYWGRIKTLLDGDLLYRGRQLGQLGHDGLFNNLASNVRWQGDILSIRHRRFSGHRRLAGEGLLLVPSAFVWPNVFSSTIPPWQPSLTYPARGVATLWETDVRQSPPGLGRVIGTSRARLLALLEAPTSTTDLAPRMGMTAGGVSQHLGALHDVGLVTPFRIGRSVLYARTAIAEALLAPDAAHQTPSG